MHDIIEVNREQLEKICSSHNLLLDEEVLKKRRDKYIQKGRSECYAYLRNTGYKYETIAKAFNFDSHATVLYSLRTHFPHKIKNVNSN